MEDNTGPRQPIYFPPQAPFNVDTSTEKQTGNENATVRKRKRGVAACESCSDLKIRCEREPGDCDEPCKRCAKTNRSCVPMVKNRPAQIQKKPKNMDPDGLTLSRRKKQKLNTLPVEGEMLSPGQYSASDRVSSSKPFPATVKNLGLDEVANYSWTGQVDWIRNRDSRGTGCYVSPYLTQPVQQNHSGSHYQYPAPNTLNDNEFHHKYQKIATNAGGWESLKPAVPGTLVLPEDVEEHHEYAFGANSDDVDYQKLQSEIPGFEDFFRNHGSDDDTQAGESGRRGRGRPRRRIGVTPGGHRGPRKAAEPTGDIKIRLSKASAEYLEENYDEAKELVLDVIRINAETYEAWSLLSTIFKETGDFANTVSCLLYACHLRPKDAQQWLNCARFALEESGDLRPQYRSAAQLCYSGAIRANPRDCHEARMGKAALLREMDNSVQAITEYRRLLEEKPHDTTILRCLAECYIDRDDVTTAKELYQRTIAFYQASDGNSSSVFGWSDVNIYLELLDYLGQHEEAIRELKSLSRWVLGRQDEVYWDFLDDDREWDADDVRRLQIPNFIGKAVDQDLYGNGLPIELHVKLGIYRLRLGHTAEALSNLSWLDSGNLSKQQKVFDYPDLFFDAASGLREAGLYHDALAYYKALQSIPEAEASLYLEMGRCYMEASLHDEAEECFQTAIQFDENHIQARLQLAKLYEFLSESEQALICLTEVMNIRRLEIAKNRNRSRGDQACGMGDASMPVTPAKKRYYIPRRRRDPAEVERQDKLLAEHLSQQYTVIVAQLEGMRAGEQVATAAWMNAASDLIEAFRGSKKLYPWDKYARFVGYMAPVRRKDATPLDADIADMANRISERLGAEIKGKPHVLVDLPTNFRGIAFSVWLDIFLEYALCLTKAGKIQEAYEMCEAAKDAVVFYHDREAMFLIHVSWCTCALLANDEASCVSVCRFFTKEYQFTTDSYRMFTALTRLTQSPISWYSSGSTQKYLLRHIKAMDFGLVGKEFQDKLAEEKAAYTAQDDAGHLIINKEMDVALLMLYGHILYTGSSYTYALNYFFRAYALDSENPMVNLSIGLGYIHWALKRQSENRQFHIMQGMMFMFRYYDSRSMSSNIEERQEAHYNIARTYHTLGLAHLALPYYSKVLDELTDKQKHGREDLVHDAAFNLQSLYAMSGNFKMAKKITDSWLVI